MLYIAFPWLIYNYNLLTPFNTLPDESSQQNGYRLTNFNIIEDIYDKTTFNITFHSENWKKKFSTVRKISHHSFNIIMEVLSQNN